ncbi:MAG: AMP-binding protein [Chloroflexi bacterium]|nr:AMP-binding protein [Chloroflexota bacterium]
MKDWLAERAAVAPQKLALIIGVDSWTYGELDTAVSHLAAHLDQQGIQPGQFVAALLPNSLEYVCLIHALARIGAALVPLNTRLTTTELQWQAEHVGAKWLVYDKTHQEKAEKWLIINGQRLMINESWFQPAPLTIHNSQFTINHCQAVVFTSGTSGKPKGAMITFANHFWSATASSYRLGVQSDDRWLSVLPLYHVGGLAAVWRSCLYGTAVILHNRFDLETINRSLDNDAATLISLVPTMLHRLLQTRDHWPPSLRLILLGGAAAQPELIEKANSLPKPTVNEPPLNIHHSPFTIKHSPPLVATTYGLTEAASQVATMPPEEAARKPGSVGKPLMFTSIKIVDKHGNEQPPNQIGEIVVTGPTVMAGYFDPQTSDFLKKSDVSSLHTGDMGYLDEDGDLWIVQRRSDLIVSGGENVYPSEVEEALRGHTAVSQTCVVGVPHPEWGQQVAAMIQLKPGQSVTESELLAFSREQLAGYKTPRLMRFVEALPQTASGKIARRKVVELMRET